MESVDKSQIHAFCERCQTDVLTQPKMCDECMTAIDRHSIPAVFGTEKLIRDNKEYILG